VSDRAAPERHVPATCSGIVVTARPGELDAVRRRLEALPGVTVHAVDPPTGRLMVTQEAADTRAQMEGLRAMQRLPGVLVADLVYHLREPRLPRRPALEKEGRCETDCHGAR